MRSSSKSQLDLSRKRQSDKHASDKAEAPLRKSSPAAKLGLGRRTPSFDSPFARLAAQTRPLTRMSEERQVGLPRKSSYSDIYTDPSNRSSSPKARASDPASEITLSINKTLTDRLRALGPHYDVKDRYLIFQDTFSTVIGLESSLSLVLRRIKNGYEEVLAQYLHSDFDRELSRTSKQVQEMQQLVDMQQQEKEKLLDIVNTLRKEGERLKVKAKEQTEKIKMLEGELKDALETVRRDPQRDLRALQEEIIILKTREKAFLSALRSAKQDNISVSDLLQSFSRHRKSQSSFIPTAVPKLSLPIATSQPFGLLSPIRKAADGDRSDQEARESLASFCQDFEALPRSRF